MFRSYDLVRAARGSSLSPSQNLVLVHMAHRAGPEGRCWAAVATLASDTGLGVRTVQAAIRALVGLGVLVEVAAPEHRTRTFTFAPDAIPHPRSSCTPADPAPHPRSSCTPPPQILHPTPADPAPKEEEMDPTLEQQDLPLPPRVIPGERHHDRCRSIWDALVPGYPWQLRGRDRQHLRAWIDALAFDADPELAAARLYEGIRRYVAAAAAHRTFPRGDAPTVRWFTEDLAKWVPRIVRPAPRAEDEDEVGDDIAYLLGPDALAALGLTARSTPG
jgi:Helix-turn-helix domain